MFSKLVSIAVTIIQRNISKMTSVAEFISILWPCKRGFHHFMKNCVRHSFCSFNYSSANLITSVGDVLLGGWYFLHTMKCILAVLVSINWIKKLQLEKKSYALNLYGTQKSNGKQVYLLKTYCLCKPIWITKSTPCILVIVQGLSYYLSHSVNMSRIQSLNYF